MKPVVSGQWSVVSLFVRLSCLLLTAFCLLSCSVPNLEDPDCTRARDIVREFYSFHFGNDMVFSAENLERRKAYLTPTYFADLNGRPSTIDPFTRTDDVPKAFRVGECHVIEPRRRAAFRVLLFWRTDTRTDQRAINVETKNVDGKWLIDAVSEAADL